MEKTALSSTHSQFRTVLFCKNSQPSSRMIPRSLEVETQRENETTNGVYSRLEAGALNSLKKLSLMSRPPAHRKGDAGYREVLRVRSGYLRVQGHQRNNAASVFVFVVNVVIIIQIFIFTNTHAQPLIDRFER